MEILKFKNTIILLILLTFIMGCSKDADVVSSLTNYYENQEGVVDVRLTFENFKKHVKALTVNDFTLISITAGEDSDKEYVATYKNKSGSYLFVKIGELATSEPIWYDIENTYLLDERKAEYSNTSLIYGLTIHLPQIEAEMSVHALIDLGKSNFEAIARQSGFLTIEPETIAWPAILPETHKFKGWLLEIEIYDYDEGEEFSKQMDVTMMVNDDLAASYKEKYNTYYDEKSNHIVFPDGTYMIVPDQYYDDNIYNIYKKYDRITFHYYLP